MSIPRTPWSRLSRITVILIRPGYSISFSIARRDLVRDQRRALVVDLARVDDHPDLAPGAHREDALDARWRGGDLLEVAKPRRRTARAPRRGRPGRAPGDGVGGLDDHRLDGPRLDLVVVGLHRVGDRLGLAVAARDLGADERVRALDLVA